MSEVPLEETVLAVNETYAITKQALQEYQSAFLTILDQDHALHSLTYHLKTATQQSPEELLSQYLQFHITPYTEHVYLIEDIRLKPSVQERMDKLRAFYTTDGMEQANEQMPTIKKALQLRGLSF